MWGWARFPMAASPKLLQAGSVVVTLRAPGSVSQEVGVGQASGRGLFLPLSPLCSSCAPPQAQVLAPTAHIPSSQLKCLERRSAPAQPVIGHRSSVSTLFTCLWPNS